MPHRQVVLAIPKRLRANCLYRRRLLGEIARVAAHSLTAAIRTLTGERDLAVGIVACLQTHGSRANWHPHPHLHLLVTGEKVVLALRVVGGEHTAAWQALLEDLTTRGLGRPALAISDGSPGAAAASVRDFQAITSATSPAAVHAAIAAFRRDQGARPWPP